MDVGAALILHKRPPHEVVLYHLINHRSIFLLGRESDDLVVVVKIAMTMSSIREVHFAFRMTAVK